MDYYSTRLWEWTNMNLYHKLLMLSEKKNKASNKDWILPLCPAIKVYLLYLTKCFNNSIKLVIKFFF